MYISPEFQLGQVYDGTMGDSMYQTTGDDLSVLYRPVYTTTFTPCEKTAQAMSLMAGENLNIYGGVNSANKWPSNKSSNKQQPAFENSSSVSSFVNSQQNQSFKTKQNKAANITAVNAALASVTATSSREPGDSVESNRL